MTILTGTLNDATEELVRYVRTVLPNIPLEAVELELMNVLRDFCTRSNAWFETDSQPIDPEAVYYEIGAPTSGAEVATILAVAKDGRRLSGWSGLYSQATGDAQAYTPNPDQNLARALTTIKFNTPITGSGQLQVTVALRPRRGTAQAPDQLVYQYFDALANGILARAQRHPNRPYTNPGDSDRRDGVYLAHIGRARANMQSRFAMLTAPWRYPQAAPGRGRV